MVVLVRGTSESSNYADRILAAMASTAMQRYAKHVVVLQATSRHPVDQILFGKRLSTNHISTSEYSFEDSGMDALLRKIEMGHMDGITFSDYCIQIARSQNGFDVAPPSKRPDFAEYLVKNQNLFRELVKNALAIYDMVFILADCRDKELIPILEEIATQEVVCVPQGPKQEFRARPDAFIAVKNYDSNSAFNSKVMSKDYGVKAVFPFPYNIGFKDACLNQYAISYMNSNVSPESTDTNYFFVECVSQLVGNVLGLSEPVIKEHNFVYKKTEGTPQTAEGRKKCRL